MLLHVCLMCKLPIWCKYIDHTEKKHSLSPLYQVQLDSLMPGFSKGDLQNIDDILNIFYFSFIKMCPKIHININPTLLLAQTVLPLTPSATKSAN